MPELIMPRLSDTMEEGVLLQWLVADGEEVGHGQEIAEIETDKATMSLSAEFDGVLHQFATAGETLSVGARIGWIGADAPSGEAAPSGTDASNGASAPSEPHLQSEPAPPAATAPGSLRVSPVARRLAAESNLDLEQIVGSGPNGRIGKRDVELAVAGAGTATVGRPHSIEGTTRPLSRVQQLIARRMVATQREVPDFSVEIDVEMDRAADLREQGEEQKVSYNDLILKACALALREHPGLNASYREDELILHSAVNVGLAVAMPGGLSVPVIRDADRKSLIEIGAEARRLGKAVRDGTIAPAELEGGTFTVSNPGMLGLRAVTPIVNGEEAAILGVGAIREELVRRNGQIVDRRVCRLRMSCDHRIVYGAEAAEFLATVGESIHKPLSLLARN